MQNITNHRVICVTLSHLFPVEKKALLNFSLASHSAAAVVIVLLWINKLKSIIQQPTDHALSLKIDRCFSLLWVVQVLSWSVARCIEKSAQSKSWLIFRFRSSFPYFLWLHHNYFFMLWIDSNFCECKNWKKN